MEENINLDKCTENLKLNNIPFLSTYFILENKLYLKITHKS